MHTFLSRVNAVSAFSLSTLAALTFGCFASTFLKNYSAPVAITAANIVLYVLFLRLFAVFPGFSGVIWGFSGSLGETYAGRTRQLKVVVVVVVVMGLTHTRGY